MEDSIAAKVVESLSVSARPRRLVDEELRECDRLAAFVDWDLSLLLFVAWRSVNVTLAIIQLQKLAASKVLVSGSAHLRENATPQKRDRDASKEAPLRTFLVRSSSRFVV